MFVTDKSYKYECFILLICNPALPEAINYTIVGEIDCVSSERFKQLSSFKNFDLSDFIHKYFI